MYIINTTGNRWYILCPNDLIHTRWFYDTPKDLYVALRMKSKHQIYENAIKKKIFTLNRYKARTGYLFKQLVIKENVLCIK